MKQRLTSYTFNPAAKQITFPNRFNLTLDGFLLITNLTNNVMIFNFAAALTGTLAGNVLTLTYDTSAMAVNDPLQIWYDDGVNAVVSTDSLDELLLVNMHIRNGILLMLNIMSRDGNDYSVDDLTGEPQ